jgi:hypothetical protein
MQRDSGGKLFRPDGTFGFHAIHQSDIGHKICRNALRENVAQKSAKQLLSACQGRIMAA